MDSRRTPVRGVVVLALTGLLASMLVAVETTPASAATVDPNDGARITQWTRNDQQQQQWQLIDSGGGYYRLRARHSGKVVEVQGGSTADGANVVQYRD